MKHGFFFSFGILFLTLLTLRAADTGEGFVLLSDGKSFAGWKQSIDNTNTWQIGDGAFVTRGPTAHLFFVGDTNAFKNFELKGDVMTEPNANGGIDFHTACQEKGFPRAGIECQVNVSHSDWIKIGSLYGLVNFGLTPARDNEWWTQNCTWQKAPQSTLLPRYPRKKGGGGM